MEIQDERPSPGYFGLSTIHHWIPVKKNRIFHDRSIDLYAYTLLHTTIIILLCTKPDTSGKWRLYNGRSHYYDLYASSYVYTVERGNTRTSPQKYLSVQKSNEKNGHFLRGVPASFVTSMLHFGASWHRMADEHLPPIRQIYTPSICYDACHVFICIALAGDTASNQG